MFLREIDAEIVDLVRLLIVVGTGSDKQPRGKLMIFACGSQLRGPD